MEKLKRRNCLHEVWKDFHNIKCFAHETRNGLWAMNKNLFKHIIHQAIKKQQSWLLVHYYWKIRGLKSVVDKTIIIYDLRLWKWVNSKHNTDGDWTYLDLKTNACPKTSNADPVCLTKSTNKYYRQSIIFHINTFIFKCCHFRDHLKWLNIVDDILYILYIFCFLIWIILHYMYSMCIYFAT